jgi:hypothetical protein
VDRRRTGTKMTARRIYATATLLHNGSVLVAGGNGRDAVSEGWLASAERYLPWTNSWVKAGYFRRPRGAQTATRLLDGHVLLAGGVYGDTSYWATTELYEKPVGPS